jgi:hypothetical protein
MSKTITVTIEQGKARVETEGFAGAACRDATALLERAMGQTEADETTPEFHEVVPRTIAN